MFAAGPWSPAVGLPKGGVRPAPRGPCPAWAFPVEDAGCAETWEMGVRKSGSSVLTVLGHWGEEEELL